MFRRRCLAWQSLVLVTLLALLLLPTALGFVQSARQRAPVLSLGWERVVRQSRANTCGPAVIATLSSWSGIHLTEDEVVARARLGSGGVTLGEFARLAGLFGFEGTWLRAGPTAYLERLPAPSVVHLVDRNGHFAIFLGSVTGFAHLLDPARGSVLIPASQFRAEWSGRLFIFASPLYG